MAKERDLQASSDKKMLVGVVWNCAAELKLLLTALLFLCTLATVLQFLPPSRFFQLSPSDIRLCINPPPPSKSAAAAPSSHLVQAATAPPPPTSSPPPAPEVEDTPYAQPILKDVVLNSSIIKRAFNPIGAAAYNFILMGAYRGGVHTFSVIGLSSKPLHVYSNPTYQCEWVSSSNGSVKNHTVTGKKYLTDWGYGRVYTVVVVNCTFQTPVGVDGSGGKLILHASTGGGGDSNYNITDRIEALEELPHSVDVNLFTSAPKYDYLYCGSSLYGNLSPQRVREWIAYHVRFFGPKSHFVIHDAGGIHPEVLGVLKPWMELGYVTLQDIKDQERFDGYYHNQFLVVNDCLHRYKFMAKWMFFFDVDEFIYVPPKSTIKSVLDLLSEYSQFTIEQMPMSNKLCLSADGRQAYRKWGFEKLVYKDTKRGIRRDRKYAVQPRSLYATGVHMSQHLDGKTTHKTESRIQYFHYHGTIAERREPCRNMTNESRLQFEGTPYAIEPTMRKVAATVKRFELKMIGTRLQKTRQ